MNFSMFGALVNFGAVILGGGLGLLLKKGIPEKISDTILKGMALCVLWIGITGAIKAQNALVMIISILCGAVFGELVDLDRRVTSLGDWIQKRIGGTHGNVTKGFVSATMLFCVGAMSVLGPLESGLMGDHSTQLTKSVIDCVCAVIYASSLGIGVVFSAVPILVWQGGITLVARWVEPILTEAAVIEMTATGSLLIIGLALNMLGLTKLKIMNYLPAVFFAVIFCRLFEMLTIYFG